MDFFQNTYYYQRLYKWLLIIGSWPYVRTRSQKLRVFALFAYLMHVVTLQILRMVRTNFDLEILVNVIPEFIAALVVIIKLATTLIHLGMIRNLFEIIKSHWQEFNIGGERGILMEYADKARLVSKGYVICIESALVVLVVQQLSPCFLDLVIPLNQSRPRNPIFELEYFVDETDYYYAIVAHMVVTVQVAAWILIGTDLAFLYSTMHACGLCDIVGYRFQRAFDDIEAHFCKTALSCSIRRKLEESIKTHKTLLQYADNINACYSNSLALQCLIAIISLSLILFQLFKSVLSHDPSSGVVHIMYIVAFCIPLCFVMVPGQLLLNTSEKMFHDVYCGNWYMGCTASAKLLVMTMRMSFKPLTLYILYYIPLSLETFSMMMQTTMSYFMVLYSAYTS